MLSRMRRTKLTTSARTALSIVVFTLVLAACGGTGGTTVTTTTAVSDQATTTSVQASGTSTAVDASAATVDANTASVDEIASALAAAGVDNADRWAREVVEYRPYDTADPNLTHLRDELAKYNPAEGVVDLIVSTLEV